MLDIYTFAAIHRLPLLDEAANICLCDLCVGADDLTVKIPLGKSDQLRNGNEVVIVRAYFFEALSVGKWRGREAQEVCHILQ